MIEIIGLDALKRKTRRWKDDFRPSSRRARVLLNRVGRANRDFARNKITTQDEGRWEPLSKWTVAKTGRRKALITLRNTIVFKVTGETVRIYSNDPQGRLAKHARGYRNPEIKNINVFIPLKRPSALAPGPNLSKSGIFIKNQGEGIVPRRNVWGTVRERDRVINPIVRNWVTETINRRR